MKNLVWLWSGSIAVVTHAAAQPSYEEWSALMLEFKEKKPTGLLVYTIGGSPSAMQRKQMRDVFPSAAELPPTAVITNSSIARIAITAFNLFFNNKIKAFEPSDFLGAVHYVGVSESRWPALKGCFKELADGLGIKPPFV